MKSINLRRRIAAGLSSLGLVSGLVVASGAAPVHATAGIGPVYPEARVEISVVPEAGSVDIADGQTLEVVITAELQAYGYSGWDSNPTQFSMSEFSLGSLPSGVSVTSTKYYWTADNTSDPMANCHQGQTFTTDSSKVNFTLTVSCKDDINRVWGEIDYVITNTSGSDQTVNTNTETAEMLVGGVSESSSYVRLEASYVEQMDESGITIPDNASSYVYLDFGTLCIASAAAGETLDIERVGTYDGVDLPQYDNNASPSQTLYLDDQTSGFYSYASEYPYQKTIFDTYDVTSSNRTIYGARFQIRDSGATLHGTLLIASLDLTLAGESQLETCSSGGGGGGGGTPSSYPVLSGLRTTKPSAEGKGQISAAKSLPLMSNGQSTNSAVAGPVGDAFYWGIDSSGAKPKANVVRITSSGTAAKIGGTTTKLVKELDTGALMRGFGWYGANASKYVLLATDGSTGYKIYFGNLADGSGTSTKTLTGARVTAICGDGYMPNLNLVSAPTPTPIVNVFCSPMGMGGDWFSVYGKLEADTGSAMKITLLDLPKPTVAKPCVYMTIGRNSKATGTNVAMIVYAAVGVKTSEDLGGMPSDECAGKSISSRSLLTVTAAGVTKKSTVTGAPFGTTESIMSRIAPGKTANTWIMFFISGGFTSPGSTVTKGYTISATGQIAAKGTISLGSVGTSFVAPGGMMTQDALTPIKELPNGTWLAYRTQLRYDQSTYTIALAKYNPTTGAVTTGDALKLASYSQPAGKYINVIGTDSAVGSLRYFVLTAAGKYKVATWKSYTS